MARYLGIADETVMGTPVSPPTTFLDVRSIGLHEERDIIEAPGMTPLGPLAQMPGTNKVTGDIALYASSENLMKFLKYLVGAPTTTQDASATRYKHVFDPVETLKWGTFYKGLEFCGGTTAEMLQYVSTIVTSGKFEVSVNNPLQATFSCLGVKGGKVSSISLGTLSTIRPFISLDAKLYWDIAESDEIANCNKISFTYERPVADDAYAMNYSTLQCFIGGAPKASGSMDLIFNNWTAYTKFWGASSGPVEQPVPVALSMKFTGPSLGGAGEFANHGFKIQCPSVTVKAINDPVELRDKIIQSVDFVCSRGAISPTTLLTRFTLWNTIATA
jgi:hypothetical protein